jgi:predicted nuclease with TOPRIM domain
MSFCPECASRDANLEIVTKRHYDEVQSLKARIKELEDEVESISLDLAFYNGDVTNLSCNNK